MNPTESDDLSAADPVNAIVESRSPEIVLPPGPRKPRLLTLTIEVLDCTPRVWRRVSCPGDVTLDVVHHVFQAVMGWADSHLHRFQLGPVPEPWQAYFLNDMDELDDDEGIREEEVRLDQVLREPGDEMNYLYDFGDRWEHLVTLESVSRLTWAGKVPMCLAGAGACPPEDVGGTERHGWVAAWLRAGGPADDVPEPFESAADLRGWLPAGYHPDAFRADEMTAAIRCLRFGAVDFDGDDEDAKWYLQRAFAARDQDDPAAFLRAVITVVGPLNMLELAHRAGTTLDVLYRDLVAGEDVDLEMVDKLISIVGPG